MATCMKYEPSNHNDTTKNFEFRKWDNSNYIWQDQDLFKRNNDFIYSQILAMIRKLNEVESVVM